MTHTNGWSPEVVDRELSNSFCVFVARRPICDQHQRSFGYELVFRNNWKDRLSEAAEVASRRVLDVSVAYGLHTLVGKKAAFVNCAREVIVDGLVTLLPSTTILQLEGKYPPTEDLLSACRRLSAHGYRLALRDYCQEWQPLLPFLSFIKNSRLETTDDEVNLLRSRSLVRRIQFVAESVETTNDLQIAVRKGYQLFQGGFIGLPLLLTRDAFATTLNRIQFLDELRQPELDLDKVLSRLKEEPSLSFRLLRLANSAAMSTRETIRSIRMAFLLVGENQFRKLAHNAFSTELFECVPEKHMSILRTARFCELMAAACGLDPELMYLFGMLAVALPFLGIDATALADVLKVPHDVLIALAGGENVYTRVLRCSESYQRGEWVRFLRNLEELGPAGELVTQHCIDAQRWADETFLNSR